MDEVEKINIDDDQEVTVRVPIVKRKAEPETEKVGEVGEVGAQTQPDTGDILLEGTLILDKNYRVLRLLHQRERVNLYLGERISETSESETAEKRFVAIRELVLTDLSPEMRAPIEQAAFEEFVSPAVLGSSSLPGAGDRARVEGDRHYLVMQLRPARGKRQPVAVTLAELLLSKRQWPIWLDMDTALEWGIQLCRIVARLHKLGAVLGDIDPTIILVPQDGPEEWAPVLLISWPPAAEFWPLSVAAPLNLRQIFPIDIKEKDNAFVAPETFEGIWDERSDVYSLGAILYLLLTRYAPAAALRRIDSPAPATGEGRKKKRTQKQAVESLGLIPPYLFNDSIYPQLERIVLRALSLSSDERYQSVFAFVEALEAIAFDKGFFQASVVSTDTRRVRNPLH